jgi:hypothetical protein
LFINDAIDEQQPFAAVRESALDIISRSELESVCLRFAGQRAACATIAPSAIRLNGKLNLPDVAKYRALEADLVSSERWKNSKDALIAQTQLPKLASKPDVLTRELKHALDSRLQYVSDYLEKSDNRKVVWRNLKGKRSWRPHTGSKL